MKRLPAIALFGALAAVPVARAADAKPIRVGIFNGMGTGTFWHTNVHTAANEITTILTLPESSALGPEWVLPKRGIQVTKYGTPSGQLPPNIYQVALFRDALDSLDVVVLNNNTKLGTLFPDSTAEREAVEKFARTKGIVALHATADLKGGNWPELKALIGTDFRNHPSSDRMATLHLDSVAKSDPSWRFLNRGLPDTARFVEEWHSYEDSSSGIRALPGLKVAVRVDEASYANGLGGAYAMGTDHPISWYRQLEGGGRLFFTGIGHRAQNYLGTGNATTPEGLRFFRRQLYNAILWAAKVDSTGTVAVPPARTAAPDWTLRRVSKGVLLEFRDEGPHTVELFAPNGGRLLRRVARGSLLLQAPGHGLHALRVSSGAGSSVRSVVLP